MGNANDQLWRETACAKAGISSWALFELCHRFPMLHSELERIDRELHNCEKESACLAAIQWAQAMPLNSTPPPRAKPDVQAGEVPRIRFCIRRVSIALLIGGLLLADLSALAMIISDGGSKYFGAVLGGLAAATLGGLGLAQRLRSGAGRR